MPEIEDRLFTPEEGSTDAQLAINLILKLLVNLKSLGKIDDDELTSIATSLIAELSSDKERFDAWERLERLSPGFERPKD